MMLVGFIWAAFAPLLLVALALMLAVILRRFGLRNAFKVAMGLVVVPVAILYGFDRRDFMAACDERQNVGIMTRADADGFVLTSGTANSFGTRYLYNEGFSYFETLDYMQGYKGWVRYEKNAAGQIVTRKIEGPTARYEVRERHQSVDGSTSFSHVEVMDRQTGTMLAKASDGSFLGGRMRWFLGAWGSANCTSRGTGEGGRQFSLFYHLARETLRPPKG